MPSHTPETIGYFFIHHYYNFLADRMYDRLSVMYDDNCTVYHDDWESYLSIVGTNSNVKDEIQKVKATGKDEVQKLIIDEREKFVYKIAVNNVDIQPIIFNTADGNDLILISVLGEISKDIEDAGAYSFSQIFTVKGQSNSYAIVNEIFRFFPVDTIDDYVFVDEEAVRDSEYVADEEEQEDQKEGEDTTIQQSVSIDDRIKTAEEIEEQEELEEEQKSTMEEEKQQSKSIIDKHEHTIEHGKIEKIHENSNTKEDPSALKQHNNEEENEPIDITKKLMEEEKENQKKLQQKEKQEKKQELQHDTKDSNNTTNSTTKATNPLPVTTTSGTNNSRIVPAQVPAVSAWQRKPASAKIINSHATTLHTTSLPAQPTSPPSSIGNTTQNTQPSTPVNSQFVVHIKFDKEDKLTEDDLKITMESKFGPVYHCSIKPQMHYGFVHFMRRETQATALAIKKVTSSKDGIIIQIFPKIKNTKKTSAVSSPNNSMSSLLHHSHKQKF